MIRYLKTDAAEAAVLTGCKDRVEAARILSAWTGGEVMVTYNEEVLLCSGEKIWTSPFTAKKLPGRSGRGDTTFAAYLGERVFRKDPGEALDYAAALCSIKMESEGPFTGNRNTVFDRIKRQAS
jgi:sugar/nucleoside kinase (ribokinase family)